MKPLSIKEMQVMSVIWELGEENPQVTTDEIAEKLKDVAWDRPSLHSFIKKLISKGFIKVERSASDKRCNVYTICISSEAFTLEQVRHLSAYFRRESLMRSYIASFSADSKNLDEVLDELRKEIDKLSE